MVLFHKRFTRALFHNPLIFHGSTNQSTDRFALPRSIQPTSNPLLHPSTHPFIHPPTDPLIHPSTDALTHSSINLPTHIINLTITSYKIDIIDLNNVVITTYTIRLNLSREESKCIQMHFLKAMLIFISMFCSCILLHAIKVHLK